MWTFTNSSLSSSTCRTQRRIVLSRRYSARNLPERCAIYLQMVLPPAPFPSSSGWPQRTRAVSTEENTEKSFNELLVLIPVPVLWHYDSISLPDVLHEGICLPETFNLDPFIWLYRGETEQMSRMTQQSPIIIYIVAFHIKTVPILPIRTVHYHLDTLYVI